MVSVHLPTRAGITGRRRLVREVGLALVTAGFVVLLFVVYELVGTNLSEEQSQAKLARAFNAAVTGARPAPGPTTSLTASPARPGAAGHKGAPDKKAGAGPGGGPSATAAGHVKGSIRRGAKKVGSTRHGAKKAGSGAALSASVRLPPPGGALDHMVIPAIGVDRYVVEGVGELDLQMGPGHYPGTPLPGQDGNVGIAGHRTTFGAPFFRLNELVPGDLIYLTDTDGRTWAYDVVKQWVVPPSDTAVLDTTHKPVLTLTTCNPRFEATTRLVVRADLVERLPHGAALTGHLAQPRATKPEERKAGPGAATSRPVISTLPVTTTSTAGTSSPPTTSANHSGATPGSAGVDSPTVGPPAASASSSGGGAGAWTGALGWGALALLGWVVTRVIASRRYRYVKVGVLVCGALICLVPLWFSFANVVDLLPANL